MGKKIEIKNRAQAKAALERIHDDMDALTTWMKKILSGEGWKGKVEVVESDIGDIAIRGYEQKLRLGTIKVAALLNCAKGLTGYVKKQKV